MSAYAELHCLSNFTFLRGASHPGELVARAAALGYSALALTDECSVAGVVRAYEEAKKHRIKLLVGAEFRTLDDLHVVLLAPTRSAYAEICALITRARLAADKGEYRLTRADFASELENCLALWVPGADPRAGTAAWMRERFAGRCWIAVELHLGGADAARLARLRQLGATHGLPLLAAGDVHMHAPERRALQDTLTAIRHRCTLAAAGHRLYPNGERHLRSCEQLARIYPPELLAATLQVAERCEFSLNELRYQYPRELVPQGMDASQHLRNLTEEGLRTRWPHGVPEKIRKTIDKELRLIGQLQYEHFFLTVHEIVQWARTRPKTILCQGRGSAANSVVCYALRITEVDPDKIAVLFERFISAERNEPPDIDVDFEHERREEVIQHVFEKYGRDRAALAATVITYRPKSALRDVGKALGLDADLIDRLAKAQAYWDDWETFRSSVASQGLHLDADVVRRLCALVKELLNFPRHLSQHVGGFVIARDRVSDLVPIENAAMPERQVIQWDKNDLEALGLLKVDVLALGMLTAVQRTFDLLAKAGAGPTCMEQIPPADEETYDMICRADTIGVFQIESRAQMSMLPRLRPRNYYDLVIEVAIVRPGPIKGGMVHPYLQRRHLPPEEVPYPSEELRPVLEKTRGVPIFQEQVMQIAVVAAGFSPGEADELRRAMGAWQRSGNMNTYQRKLLDGMRGKGYSEEFAQQIYKQIEGFGEYGFPESHSASFALLTYVSSYLKRHHAAAFFAGLINSQPMGFYQPAQLLEQAKRQRVGVLPVDVTVSEHACTLEPDARGQHAIRLGMRLVKGLREEEAQRIVAARAEQSFVSMDDAVRRSALPPRATRALAMCGAFRTLTEHRNLAFWEALATERARLPLAAAPAGEKLPELPPPSEWEEILRDYYQLGLSTGRHPLALLRRRLQSLGVVRRRDLDSIGNGSEVCVSGLVTHLQHPQTANGVIFASLEDETGINNIIFWPDVFAEQRPRIIGTTLLVVLGQLQREQGVVHVVARRAEDYSHWVRRLPRKSRDFH
ncbi:MAG TPA: error-prone DNA polymerase [Steroidobacteraceae bacterium]